MADFATLRKCIALSNSTVGCNPFPADRVFSGTKEQFKALNEAKKALDALDVAAASMKRMHEIIIAYEAEREALGLESMSIGDSTR